MLDPSGNPTPGVRAFAMRELLLDYLERLQDLESSLNDTMDSRERIRADAIAVAIEHLQQAIDALEIACRDLTNHEQTE